MHNKPDFNALRSSKAKRCAVLWTGGKDSYLALHLTLEQGRTVDYLVTFCNPDQSFLAHSQQLMQRQAQALGIKHIELPIKAPYQQAYNQQLAYLKRHLQVGHLISGDIAPVDNQPNWMQARCDELQLTLSRPLWRAPRIQVLNTLFEHAIEAMITCVDTQRLAPSWAGRILSANIIAQWQGADGCSDVDLCGENGEYHTMVIDSPRFKQPIEWSSTSIAQHGHLAYLAFNFE